MNVAYLTIVIMFVIIVIYYVMFYVPAQYRKDISRKIGDLAAQQRLMDRLRDETNTQLILVMKSHNGDGVPRPGYKIKVTALYESYEQPFRNMVDDYKDIEVDGDYLLMLENVKMYGYTAMFTNDMKDSLLRRIYEKEGVVWSYVFFIGRDRQNWYYAIVGTSDHKSTFERGHGLNIELFVNKIRSMYDRLNKTPLKIFKRQAYL